MATDRYLIFNLNASGGPSKFTKHEPLGPLVGNGGEQVEPSSVKTGHLRDRKRPKLDDNMEPMPMIGIRPAYWCNMCYISLPGELICNVVACQLICYVMANILFNCH
jgi:hypothetical protein